MGRREEILRRKAKYDEDVQAYEADMKARRNNLADAERSVLGPIKSALERDLGKYSMLHFDVRVERNYRDTIDVAVSCNEYNKFDEDSALAWDYRVQLNSDGTIQRESSSWSGLKATTSAQLESLRQTLSALEYLNSVDWGTLLDVTLPDYETYYKDALSRPKREDFETELLEADLEELVGSNKIVKVRNWGETCPYRGDVWLWLKGETASQYRVAVISDFTVRQGRLAEFFADGRLFEQRVRKTSVKPYVPLETMEVPTNEA